MAAKGYCTYSDVSGFLGKTFSAGQQTQCNALIERAEIFIDGETGRGWLVGAQTNEAFFWPPNHIFLRYTPITSIEAVTGRDGLGESETTLVADTDYEVRSLENGQIYLVTPSAYDRIMVDYTPVASVPADIKQATIEIVANWMQPSLAGSFGLDSIQLPDYSVRFARSHVQEVVPPFAMQVIARYRYPVHG